MNYTLTISYYDGPAIVDEYAEELEALSAWDDMLWAATYAPRDQFGDVCAVTLRKDGEVLQSRRW